MSNECNDQFILIMKSVISKLQFLNKARTVNFNKLFEFVTKQLPIHNNNPHIIFNLRRFNVETFNNKLVSRTNVIAE